MALPKKPAPALQLVAVFSRHEPAIDWVHEKLADEWGQIALASPRFDHSETTYYQSTMGSGLLKQFFVVAGANDQGTYYQGSLAASKLQSNAWEQEYAAIANYAEARPVNIDPGYLTLTKLVLASAKDRAHRIYLADGIYAEECLYYLDHRWQPRPWTYPDYQRSDFHAFFIEARELLKRTIQQASGD